MLVHLNRYDTIAVWCESDDIWGEKHENDVAGSDAPGDPEEANCVACLQAVMGYATRAAFRLYQLGEQSSRRGLICELMRAEGLEDELIELATGVKPGNTCGYTSGTPSEKTG